MTIKIVTIRESCNANKFKIASENIYFANIFMFVINNAFRKQEFSTFFEQDKSYPSLLHPWFAT